ncbi:MAG TPA: hypothetical protein VFC03_15265 [Acidimicrobiales bacterium]|nr:hypothetical protein [Acidimicrobiales bacterium]
MVKNTAVPFTPKPLDPRAAEVLVQIANCTEGLRSTATARRELVAKRAQLVAKAREYNVTLDTLATTMGVSRARVQQIEAQAGK